MLAEVQKGKQELIQHIQAELSYLKAKRELMDKQKSKNNYISPTTISHMPKTMKVDQSEKIILKNKLSSLHELYQTRKQLRKAGIEINDPDQIIKSQNDPKFVEYMRRKKEQKQKIAQKQLIIQEEMVKVQKFLASKKTSAEQVNQMQEMNYRRMLEGKAELLEKYQELVLQKKLNRVEKDELIQMTFQMIRQGKRVKKSTLKSFLLANPEFCAHFYITHQQINRDLQVHATKQQNMLNQIQLTQFLKSIEITSKSLKPSLNYQSKKIKQETSSKQTISQQLPAQGKQLNLRQVNRKFLQYFRKVFKNLDRFNENIVRRIQYMAILQKGMYLDPNKDKEVRKDQLKMLSSFMKTKTKQKGQKNYYIQLDSKFINFGEIQNLWKLYCSEKNKNTQNKNQHKVEIKQENNLQTAKQNSHQPQVSSEGEQLDEYNVQIIQPRAAQKQLSQEDYEHYGWLHKGTENVKEERTNKKIKDLDQNLSKIKEKYEGFMIEESWGQYRANFDELQAFIKTSQRKGYDSRIDKSKIK